MISYRYHIYTVEVYTDVVYAKDSQNIPLHRVRYNNDTMFCMLNCCKKSAISNFHYLFYRQKLITKAVSKGSPKNSIDCPTQLSSNKASPGRYSISNPIDCENSKTIFSWLTGRPWSRGRLSKYIL